MDEPAREPALNIPASIVAVIASLVVVHAAAVLAPLEWRLWSIEQFAFIPARLTVAESAPQGLWMWLTYALLHGDGTHLTVNALWLAIFGTPVVRRLGVARFAMLSIAGAVGAAGLHLASHWGATTPMIGYSGVVSALTGAAARFAFVSGGGSRGIRFDAPRLSVVGTFLNRAPLGFVAVWMIANLIAGNGVLTPDGAQIAWEAHIGGFLVGLFLFGWFDPYPSLRSSTKASDSPSELKER